MRQLALLAAATAMIALTGCKQEAADPSAQQTASDSAGHQADASDAVESEDIRLANARIQLPAVAGRPGVAYFDFSHKMGDGKKPDFKITGVSVEGVGRTEMHETITKDGVSSMQQISEVVVAEGDEASFMPGGLHVMLFDITLPADAKSAALGLTVNDGTGGVMELSIPASITRQGATDHGGAH